MRKMNNCPSDEATYFVGGIWMNSLTWSHRVHVYLTNDVMANTEQLDGVVSSSRSGQWDGWRERPWKLDSQPIATRRGALQLVRSVVVVAMLSALSRYILWILDFWQFTALLKTFVLSRYEMINLHGVFMKSEALRRSNIPVITRVVTKSRRRWSTGKNLNKLFALDFLIREWRFMKGQNVCKLRMLGDVFV